MGYPQGAVHMLAARLGCERAMVGTGWATSHPDCMDRLRKHYSHLVEVSGKEGCLVSEVVYGTNSADCCMLTIEWVWSKSRVCLLMMGSVLESELIQKWRYHTFT